jgi:hypothetical protein
MMIKAGFAASSVCGKLIDREPWVLDEAGERRPDEQEPVGGQPIAVDVDTAGSHAKM